MRVLAIDIGSSSVKAGAWDGRKFGTQVRVGFRTEFDGVKAEVPADRILRAIDRAGREALRGCRGMDVVAFCAFSSGVVVTDENGSPRTPVITHQDRRSAAEAADLARKLGGKWLLEHTGNLPYPGGIGSSTLAWLRRHAGGAFRGKYRVGQLSSLVGWTLTGEWVIDPSQAAFLGMWDIQKRAWSARMCQAMAVNSACLPQVVWADQVIGRVTRRMAQRWRSVREGTPVVGGFVDTSAAMIPTPMRAGQLVHNAGSTDVLAMCMERPVPTEGILTRPVGVGKVFPQRWLAVRTIAAAGSATEWARRTLFGELAEAAWRRILKQACARAAEKSPVACEPTFAGERTAINQDAGATFSGVTLATRREDLLAAIVRGLACQSTMSYDMLSRLRRPERMVYAMGGGGAIGVAMRASWPGKHSCRILQGDGMAGLVKLAQQAMGG